MAASTSVSGKVQHVTKASSEELLRKFADSVETRKISPKKVQSLLRVPPARRKKRPSRRTACRTSRANCLPGGELRGERTSEWKALLQHSSPPRHSAVLRQIAVAAGISEKIRASDVFLHALEKTWRKMVEGASRMAAEGQCNGHVRLLRDTA